MKLQDIFKQALLLVFFAVTLNSCSSDDDNNMVNEGNSIADIAAKTENLSILTQALTKADLTLTLDGSGEFTVFAPTNAAFTAFLQAKGFATLDDVPTPVLKEILLNHVISGEVTSSSISTGYVKTLAKGSASAENTLSMYINTVQGVVLNGGTANGGAMVTSADIMADNGVIHIVNGVIDLPTIVTHAVANPDFSILVQALTRNDQPDFAGILSGTENSPFTVFAPNNTAFVSLLAELELTGLSDIPQAVLENTLKYHVVVNNNVLSTDLTNNMEVTTFQGDTFTVNLNGGATITDANNRTSTIIATDVQASNGVIHAINTVILPSL
ncbi:fasciclin domain-containing protein [Flavobacterium alkalisoli]|uniref:Fasciclin domain-containing protein n=1 Tax=Flavobacterium alkalisoli TaxID=2602769 RepID=A0A5B9FRF8_9FLAO|nr:fasciclin domain-containing protein [Flavobacterium alkalisoli]QEE48656.1 fasciclin domain-containing protein [Flavobacterium alkalisoli]